MQTNSEASPATKLEKIRNKFGQKASRDDKKWAAGHYSKLPNIKGSTTHFPSYSK
ncbi:hypothetical protein [Wolbachia endosymbiont of Cantharis cryptica]|uniref:hypothetical protein n=1 Tax=Wolbachia endosymbiont of Cantharis cryptica TaxID=3066132 RepID=UPI00376F07D5